MNKANTPCDEHHTSKISELIAISMRRGTNPSLNFAELHRALSSKKMIHTSPVRKSMNSSKDTQNLPFLLTGDFNLLTFHDHLTIS